jgi:AraC-like DNA-binding protein
MGSDQDDGEERFGDFDLWIGIRGSCQVRMLGHSLDLRPGRVILIPAEVRMRQLTGPGQELLMMYVHFDCVVSGRTVGDARPYVDASRLQLSLPGVPALALTAEIDAAGITETLYRIRAQPQDDRSELALTIAVLEILSHLREAHLGTAKSLDEERLERAVTFMEQHLDRPILLAELARQAYVSQETLGRLFRSYYRISPMRYLTRLRMARARELLQARRHNVSEVARACGYASLQYFSRAFRQASGVSPRAFRKGLPLIP